MTTDDLRSALWRAVGLTVRDLQRRVPRDRAEIDRLFAVAEQVDGMLEPAMLAVAAQLHAATTITEGARL